MNIYFSDPYSSLPRRPYPFDGKRNDSRDPRQGHHGQVPQRYSNCHYCGQMFNSRQFLIQHLNETCVERKRRHPNAPPVRDTRLEGNQTNHATRFVPTHPLPADMNMEPSRMQQWKYLPGRATADVVANLFFAGAVEKKSLTGGCGWWVVHENTVVAYGSAPVLQNYSSLIRLEYEGLLNGLQAAIRKGIRKIKIKSSSALIISHLTDGEGVVSSMKSILYTVQDLYSAIMKALKQFQYTEFSLIHPDENAYPIKLAHKAIADHLQHTEEVMDKKMKAAFDSACTSPSSNTTTCVTDSMMKTFSPKSTGSTDTTLNSEDQDSHDWLKNDHPSKYDYYKIDSSSGEKNQLMNPASSYFIRDIPSYTNNISFSTNFINSFI